jgi:hypothetical protein
MSYQQLILRSNRYLTAALLENRLINSEDVAKSNIKLLSLIQTNQLRQASSLSILLFELKALNEDKLIQHLVEQNKAALVDLAHIDLKGNVEEDLDLDLCWATMSIPFDQIGNCTCIATCYLMSKPAIDKWTEKYPNILWYVTSLRSMTTALEALEPETKAETPQPV